MRTLKFEFLLGNADILDTFFSLLSFPTLESLIFEENSDSGVIPPLARNLKLMAPQLRELHFNERIEVSEARNISEHMPSSHITTV